MTMKGRVSVGDGSAEREMKTRRGERLKIKTERIQPGKNNGKETRQKSAVSRLRKWEGWSPS